MSAFSNESGRRGVFDVTAAGAVAFAFRGEVEAADLLELFENGKVA